jgi:hypothetical protein
MASFDVSLEWLILSPENIQAAEGAAAELSRIIAALRSQAGLPQKAPAVLSAFGAAPEDSIPIILLNAEAGGAEQNGFTWRCGRNRLEIYGESGRGLCNGVFDFLDALGINWPEGDREILPSPERASPGEYALKENHAYKPSRPGETEFRRLLVRGKDIVKKKDALVLWAARNRFDALILSLREECSFQGRLFGKSRRARENLVKAAKKYGLVIEGGGWELSLLAPRRYFIIRPEMFRMEEGKRKRRYNFCPTNPDTIRLIKERGRALFRALPEIDVFHLWPDRGQERRWCSCPSCRAFTPEEQNRIACAAAADALAEIKPQGRLFFYETGEGGDIPLRPNLFPLRRFPRELNLPGKNRV